MPALASVEIQIHLIDGSVSRFVVDKPGAAPDLIASIQPNKLFTQRNILIAGSRSMTAYPTAAVARVDFVMDGFPGWQFYHNLQDVMQITHEEFLARFNPENVDVDRTDRVVVPGDTSVAWGDIELNNAERLYTEARFVAQPAMPIDRSMLFEQLFESHYLYSRRRGGGAILINPANIVRLTFYPGPPETPRNAWVAHHMEAV
jgi:hypothetical protein